jgi:3-oxoacyl-[acyl-carrier protein] reductase
MRDKTAKVILIFGGAGGIGAEIGARLASEGARLVIADLNGSQAQAKADGIVAKRGQAIGVQCDITDPELGDRAARAAIEEFGQNHVPASDECVVRDGAQPAGA